MGILIKEHGDGTVTIGAEADELLLPYEQAGYILVDKGLVDFDVDGSKFALYTKLDGRYIHDVAGLATRQTEQEAGERLEALKATDTDMVRLLAEDIIPQLVANGYLVLENLPQAAQDKLADRTTKRANI